MFELDEEKDLVPVDGAKIPTPKQSPEIVRPPASSAIVIQQLNEASEQRKPLTKSQPKPMVHGEEQDDDVFDFSDEKLEEKAPTVSSRKATKAQSTPVIGGTSFFEVGSPDDLDALNWKRNGGQRIKNGTKRENGSKTGLGFSK